VSSEVQYHVASSFANAAKSRDAKSGSFSTTGFNLTFAGVFTLTTTCPCDMKTLRRAGEAEEEGWAEGATFSSS
jgi:hypothetical protein